MFHRHLRSWMRENQVTFKDLAELIGVKNLTHYTTSGKLFPAEWIRKWADAFGWTDDQTFTFQFDRPPKDMEKDAIAEISLKRLKELLVYGKGHPDWDA